MLQEYIENKLKDLTGYIKINTNFIPDMPIKEIDIFANIEEMLKNRPDDHRFSSPLSNYELIIECLNDCTINIGGNKCLLKKGKHFYYNNLYHIYHNLYLETTKSEYKNFKFYEADYEQSVNLKWHDFYGKIKYLLHYPLMIENIVDPENETCKLWSFGGMTILDPSLDTHRCGPLILSLTKLNELVDKHKTEINNDIVENFIYAEDDVLSKLRNNENLTKYFDYYDKNFVRESMPPCILVRYESKNKQYIEDLLVEYNIPLSDPMPTNTLIKLPDEVIIKNTDTLYDNIKQMLEYGESTGMFKFCKVNVAQN